MKNLQKEILQQIKKETITPIPKIYFILIDIIKIIGILIMTIISIALLLIIIYGIIDITIVFEHISNNDLLLFLYIPIILSILFIITVIISTIFIRKTSRFYKYRDSTIFISNLFIYSIIAIFLFSNNVHVKIVNVINQYIIIDDIKLLSQSYSKTLDIWSQPEKGLLSGEIIEFNQEKLLLKTFKHNEYWEVLIDENTIIDYTLLYKKIILVKIEGDILDRRTINAKRVMNIGVPINVILNHNFNK